MPITFGMPFEHMFFFRPPPRWKIGPKALVQVRWQAALAGASGLLATQRVCMLTRRRGSRLSRQRVREKQSARGRHLPEPRAIPNLGLHPFDTTKRPALELCGFLVIAASCALPHDYSTNRKSKIGPTNKYQIFRARSVERDGAGG